MSEPIYLRRRTPVERLLLLEEQLVALAERLTGRDQLDALAAALSCATLAQELDDGG